MDNKKCPSCKITKPHSEFFRQRKKDMPSVYCKLCSQEKSRTPAARFSQAKCAARVRKIEWAMTMEEFFAVIANPCIYCNGPLAKTGLGIDRMVETEGYTSKNSVPACATCNHVKHRNFNFGEMMVLGRSVAQIRLMRGLGPDDQMLMVNQINNGRRNYRDQRPGGIEKNGHPRKYPVAKDRENIKHR